MKNYKNWSYFKKGGIIGIIVGIIILCIPYVGMFVMIGIGNVTGWGGQYNSISTIILDFIIFLIPFFVIGSLIGKSVDRNKK